MLMSKIFFKGYSIINFYFQSLGPCSVNKQKKDNLPLKLP
jgi:hypothetical protein